MKEYKNLFRNKGFINFFLAINLMTLSQAFVNISTIWIIYEETKDPLLVAIFGVLMQVPQLLFGALVARLLDRIFIQKAMTLLLVIRATIFFIIFILPFNHVMFLYVIAFLFCINSLISPSLSSGTNIIIASIIDKEKLVSANALLTIFFDLSYIFSSIAVAVLTYLNNNKLAFFISSLLILITAIMMITLQIDDTINFKRQKKYIGKDSFITSVKYICKTKNILIITVLTMLWNMFTWGTFSTLLPIYVENNLNNNEIAFGLLNSMQSAGIIVASIILGTNIFKKISIEKMICGGIIVHCAFLIGFSLSSSLELSIILLLISGIASAPVLIYKSTYLQREIPREIMGQVFSIITIISSFFYPFGSGIVAFILKFTGVKHFDFVNLVMLVSLIVISVVGLRSIDYKNNG